MTNHTQYKSIKILFVFCLVAIQLSAQNALPKTSLKLEVNKIHKGLHTFKITNNSFKEISISPFGTFYNRFIIVFPYGETIDYYDSLYMELEVSSNKTLSWEYDIHHLIRMLYVVKNRVPIQPEDYNEIHLSDVKFLWKVYNRLELVDSTRHDAERFQSYFSDTLSINL